MLAFRSPSSRRAEVRTSQLKQLVWNTQVSANMLINMRGEEWGRGQCMRSVTMRHWRGRGTAASSELK